MRRRLLAVAANAHVSAESVTAVLSARCNRFFFVGEASERSVFRWRAAALMLLFTVTPNGLVRADFLRGDANQDGRVNIGDAVVQILHIFGSDVALECLDAADSNDDGQVDVSDPLRTLTALFFAATLPSPGMTSFGPDPSCDELTCAAAPGPPAVILNEIQYNPLGPRGSAADEEFIELHNRSSEPQDVSGFRFVRGINYTIPAGTMIPAGGYLLILKAPTISRWRNIPQPKVGPYDGWLSDGGEAIELRGPCSQELVVYDDRAPWPSGADGDGPSLERVAPAARADDFHSWRSASKRGGTPGTVNSSRDVPTHPVITSATFTPARPTSRDCVMVRAVLDIEPERLGAVRLHWEVVDVPTPIAGMLLPMQLRESGDSWSTFEAELPPQPSQTLVRANLEVVGLDDTTEPLILPYSVDPDAYLSYFVYDFEMAAKLPILWLVNAHESQLPPAPRRLTAAVILEVGSDTPLVFDGARLSNSQNGTNLKFLKGAEYRGDRTVNIIPERPLSFGSGGDLGPHVEHLGFTVFEKLGALAPWAEWFRVVEHRREIRTHSQRLLIQQVNERFFAVNGLDPDGDLYRIDKTVWGKRTNLYSGVDTIVQLRTALRKQDPDARRSAVFSLMDVGNVGLYSAIGMLMSNWDGFNNNMYAYHDLSPMALWRVIPWDLDHTFRQDSAALDLAHPRIGMIGDAFHEVAELDAAYREQIKTFIAPGGGFTADEVEPEIAATETLLLEDLRLLETFLGEIRTERREQIDLSYKHIRGFVHARLAFLRAALDASGG